MLPTIDAVGGVGGGDGLAARRDQRHAEGVDAVVAAGEGVVARQESATAAPSELVKWTVPR